MSGNSRLIPISYFSPQQSIRLNAYADTIIYEPDGRRQILRAIRFGGYPEMVRALADALYAGADLEATIGAETYIFASEPKRYQRQFSHDGVYAEAVLLALDDELDSAQSEQEQLQQALQQPPRRSFLFCPADDSQRLFEELDRKTDVPMIPAFKDYVLRTLEQRSILKRLSVLSIREKLDVWVLLRAKDDANIVRAVEDGLKDGQIQIPGAATVPNGFERVSSVTDYLNAFGSVIATRIRAQFTPLYDPAAEPLSKEVMDINRFIESNAGYSLYNAQLAVAEAVTRKLKTGKSAFIVAECGSGKTKIGAAAMAALHALRTNQAHRKKVRTFNIVMCPAHVAPKWVREIHESLPNAEGVIVRSIMELDQLYERYRKGNKSIYAILSKEKARDGYMRRPAAVYHNRLCAFVCPDCGHPIEVSVCDDGSDYLVHATQRLFRRETRKNHKCSYCGASLWTAVNPTQKSNWVSWVRTDSQQKLQQLLQRRGYRAEILTDKVKTTEREAWVQKRLAAELQVLITNPSLVETGLDLNAFTTLIFYSMGTKLFTLRQASRRSWRINQTAPKVTVYLLYYQHTMQHKFLKLMASKLAAAGMIEGNFSEEGLAAMSDIQDMTTQMAKELMLGIRDSVEDLAASFKKMAVLHTAKPEGPEPVQNAAPIRQPPAVISLPPATESPQFEFAAAPQKTRKKKEVTEDANQLSFFDFVA